MEGILIGSPLTGKRRLNAELLPCYNIKLLSIVDSAIAPHSNKTYYDADFSV